MVTLEGETRLALLTLTCVPDLGPVAQARFLAAWRAGAITPAASLELSQEEYRTRFHLRRDAIEALTARREKLRRSAETLDREMRDRGVELLADPSLPADFPLLFAYGNLDLWEEPSVALLASSNADQGSRPADPRRARHRSEGAGGAIETVERIAYALARAGAHTISGHNRPGYKAAAVAARRCGAPLTLVLDRGLGNAWGEEWGRELLAPARVWDERFDREATLALSPFRFHDGWVTANARRRDQLVCALAGVLIAVSLRPGGWLEAQCQAAAARGATVLVCDPGPNHAEARTSHGARSAPRGARLIATEVAAEAALQALGPPGAGRRRAERRWRSAFVRALAEIAGVGEGRGVRDLLPDEQAPLYTYPVRGQRREAPAAAILAEALPGEEPERMVIAWLGALQPDGVLAAVLPNRFLAEAGAAAFRQRFLAQGRLLAAISLPGDFGVCLFRKRGTESDAVSSSPAALLISPTRTMQTTADRNRYLAEALEKARAVLADGVTPTGSAVPASSPPPRSARRQSPG